MNNYYQHFKTITKHKAVVMYYCFKLGLYRRGLAHDLSKYRPIEFLTSARYFTGAYSPIDKEKVEKGYSIAWQHHKGHNPHHWEYWIDGIGNCLDGGVPVALPIPMEYLLEMVCDWIGAGKVYSKEKWTQAEPWEYYEKNKHKYLLHSDTRMVLERILISIKDVGIKTTFWKLKNQFGVLCLDLPDYEYNIGTKNDIHHFSEYKY